MSLISLTGSEEQSKSQRVRSHCPDLLQKMNIFYEQVWASSRVDAGIKELIRIRCATVNTCSY